MNEFCSLSSRLRCWVGSKTTHVSTRSMYFGLVHTRELGWAPPRAWISLCACRQSFYWLIERWSWSKTKTQWTQPYNSHLGIAVRCRTHIDMVLKKGILLSPEDGQSRSNLDLWNVYSWPVVEGYFYLAHQRCDHTVGYISSVYHEVSGATNTSLLFLCNCLCWALSLSFFQSPPPLPRSPSQSTVHLSFRFLLRRS